MRILITGHEGFIGRNLVPSLRAAGHVVYGVDIASAGIHERVDIRNVQPLRDCFERWRPNAVIHLAALASVPDCEARPEYAWQVNYDGTANVASLCEASGSRLVFMSSAAVYGNPSQLPTPTTAAKQPVNVYGETKAQAEEIIKERLPGNAVVFRLFNAYGEGCERSYVIPDVIRKALSHLDPIPMQGVGAEARDFVYIRDVLGALRIAAESERPGTYNLGTGTCTSIRSVAKLVTRLLGLFGTRLQFDTSARPGDFRVSWADMSDGNTLSSWRPEWALEQGVRQTIAYYLQTNRSLGPASALALEHDRLYAQRTEIVSPRITPTASAMAPASTPARADRVQLVGLQ